MAKVTDLSSIVLPKKEVGVGYVMWDVLGCGAQDAGLDVREELARLWCDAEVCGEVYTYMLVR